MQIPKFTGEGDTYLRRILFDGRYVDTYHPVQWECINEYNKKVAYIADLAEKSGLQLDPQLWGQIVESPEFISVTTETEWLIKLAQLGLCPSQHPPEEWEEILAHPTASDAVWVWVTTIKGYLYRSFGKRISSVTHSHYHFQNGCWDAKSEHSFRL